MTALPWFRVYREAAQDPKLQRLPAETFRGWFNCLCIAAGNDGKLPPLADLAFSLRLQEPEAKALIATLIAANLIDETPAGLTPHNWHGRQFKSDSSTARVQKYRSKINGVARH